MRRIFLTAIVIIIAAAIAGIWWYRHHQASNDGWAIPEHAKVVCYRFKIPDEVESSFTLLKGQRLDEALLNRLKVASAELSSDQTKRLGEALLSPKEWMPAACYDPHHIFVFYRSDGSVSGTAEVCFGCTSVRTLPEMSEPQWYHQDFVALARLVNEIGLWPPESSESEWEKLQEDRP